MTEEQFNEMYEDRFAMVGDLTDVSYLLLNIRSIY